MHTYLSRKSQGEIPFGRFRRGWEVNFKMNFREIRVKRFDWIHLVQWWASVKSVMKARVPLTQGMS